MMVDMPPKRSDFGQLLVVLPPKRRPTTGNFVVVPKTGDVTLVMNDYKTAKFYNKLEETLPDNVASALRESLRMFPRAYVFTGREGEPLNDKNYAEFVKRVFKLHTGKNAGINAIRHAYITQVADHSKMTMGELKAIAKSMEHSTAMQDSYQLVEG